MTKARVLADFISDGSPLADGTISVSEVSGAAPLASPTFTGTVTSTGNVVLGDNDKAIFGAGSDLQIYSNNNQSFITESNSTGSLFINASNLVLRNTSGEYYLYGNSDGAVNLYHDNATKLATTSTGIDVTGDVGADTATIAGKTTTDELDLSPIASTIADTAVDVFVYDTSKDSDGGAWRKRTQGTSWYNETLNTATRGSRKEFPAVAVIVAESNQVTIYDGDDPDLPMWMVFNINGTNNFLLTGVSSITSINGKIALGNTGSYARLMLVDFLAEESYWITSSSVTVKQQGIASRNSTTSNVNSSNYGTIVHATVNDVAMTVLPNAPIDAATGLPVPTIAVGTDGGTSVIKDDGTVVDITRASNAQISSVDFYNGYLVIGSSNVGAVWYYDYIPSSDEAVTPNDGHIEYYDSGFANAFTPAYLGYTNTVTAGSYIGSTGNNDFGLTAVDFNPAAYRKSSTAFITSDFNTGWMNGAIKLATLSDTDDTDVTGSELVDQTFSNWNLNNATVDTSTYYSSPNSLKTTSSATIAKSPTFSLVAGKTYVLTFKYKAPVGGSNEHGEYYLYDGNGSEIKHWWVNAPDANWHTETFTFTSSNSGSSGQLWLQSDDTEDIYFDDVSIRLAEEDRSVNGNGLQVFGTVTKNPVATGADLVGYSGFSNSNYLQQPYNSDLDFGTGDFCINFWVNTTDVTGYPYLYARSDGSTGFRSYIMPDGTCRFIVGNHFPTTSSSIATGLWTNICFVRANGVGTIYRDGEFDNSTGVDLTTTITEPLVIGNSYNLGNPLSGSMALFRISATAPSPEQIAKIYEDEKVLFQENAQATLYGDSDAVTALAYDDTTELLHVGTSGGRSDFQGLRRVNNTTNAVGAAISASNGMIVEE